MNPQTPDNAAITEQMQQLRADRDEKAAREARRKQMTANPRPGTFANYGEALAHPDYDTATVSYVSRPSEAALEQLQKIATNDRLSVQAKAEDFTALKSETIAEIEKRFDDSLAEIEAKRRELDKIAHRSVSPSPEEADALAYTRDALQTRITSGALDYAGLIQEWEMALAKGDRATLTVLTDYGTSFELTLMRAAGQKNAQTTERVRRLVRQSEDSIASPEGRKARAELLKLEATIFKMNQEFTRAAQLLRNAAFQGNAMVDRRREDMRERLRQSI